MHFNTQKPDRFTGQSGFQRYKEINSFLQVRQA